MRIFLEAGLKPQASQYMTFLASMVEYDGFTPGGSRLAATHEQAWQR
jgi:hypothetical protein